MTLTIIPVAIDHIVLRTMKLQEMISFYCDALGCTIERQTDPAVGLTQLRAGMALIDLVNVDSELGRLGGEAPGPTGNNMDHFCLLIAPMEQSNLIAALKQAGVKGNEFQTRNGAEGFGPSIYIHDPDGNQVELRSKITVGGE